MRGGVILQGLVCYRDTGEKNGARMLCGVRFDAAYASRGEGMLAALSAKRAAKYLQKRRVSYAVFPKDYPYAEVFARCGVLPPPEKPLRMAKAAEIIRRAMARLGLAPERARIALCAPSQSAALEAAARELSKDVRYLALCAPNGERLARTLRWDCGASVHTLQTDERIAADLSVCFDDFPLPDGLVLPLGSGAVSVAYGTENLGAMARLGLAPERARIALCAPSQSAALEAAARELSKDVRYLALCAPNGERLARTLRWDCGASVHTLQTDERIAADLSVCFDDFPLPDGLVLPLGSGAVSVAYGTENLGDAAMIWNEDQLICALYASLARRADEIWVKDVKMPPDGGENANLP